MLANMGLQDIEHGMGVALLDPHDKLSNYSVTNSPGTLMIIPDVAAAMTQ